MTAAVNGPSDEAGFFAPGRVNLIGEHLDYNGGRCLPIALGVGTTTTIRRAARTSFSSAQVSDSKGWTAYAEGVLHALADDGVPVPPVEIVIDSTVPLGAGLSSSAALTCSIALAALWAADTEAEPEQVIRAAMRAENEAAGAPTGGMDQTVSVLAREGHALLIDFDDGSQQQVPWDADVIVIDTKVRHALNDGRYGERRAQCEAAAEALGVPLLARATSWDGLDGVLARRARHVVTEMARVAQVLVGQDVGAAMTASHESLRDDFEVSCPELDTAVEAALGAGAHGARMTGGGFGGSAIALVDPDRAEDVRGAVTEAFGRRGFTPPEFLDGHASRGAHRVW